MLFSEPKIPQSGARCGRLRPVDRFSALQRAENSSILALSSEIKTVTLFQCSSASRKFLNQKQPRRSDARACVSVLFSEPKIPQWWSACWVAPVVERFQCSSASRKFLNFIFNELRQIETRAFQCSSASRKFLNPQEQRIMQYYGYKFQCSSASRKFLNKTLVRAIGTTSACFSALQRAENSSIKLRFCEQINTIQGFSALQRAENSSIVQACVVPQ